MYLVLGMSHLFAPAVSQASIIGPSTCRIHDTFVRRDRSWDCIQIDTD